MLDRFDLPSQNKVCLSHIRWQMGALAQRIALTIITMKASERGSQAAELKLR
jgi:hypothetical protein